MTLEGLPRPTVELTGTDGNAFAIVMKTRRELIRAGWTREQADAFKTEAFAGDYDNVMLTCMKYAEIE